MQYSIVDFQELDLRNRVDAEYFQSDYLNVEKNLLEKDSIPLRQFCSIVGSAFYPAAVHLYEIGNLPFIRCVDCISYPVITTRQQASFENIPIEFADEYKNIKRLTRGEIVITKVGTPCYASIIHDLDDVALSRTVLGLKSITNIDPYYLTAFLRSKYGFLQLYRERELTIQYQLTLDRVGGILIFKPTNDKLEKSISRCFRLHENIDRQSVASFDEAQTLLLSELGLTDWQPKHQLSFVKSYSDTEQAGRIDADYFQPKYEEVEQSIRNHLNGYTLIKNEFVQNQDSFQIDSDQLYRYVEIGSVNASNGEITPNEVIGKDLPSNAKRIFRKGDVIISKVRTYRGAIAIVQVDGYVGSGAFCILREKGQFNKETLLTFLHSKPLLDWSLKPNTGTSYPVITDNDILNLPIPVLPEEQQARIQHQVTESFNLRKQSRLLLECAKRAVEIAIEQDEQAALDWLEGEVRPVAAAP